MNCQEVQLQLSGYLEKSLDTIRMKGIESHLSTCPFCRLEARNLSECIELVGALPQVDPPAGFTQRVMAHAREIELESPLWRRLLAVLHSTAPIQASAVVLVAILAVLIYQREPRLRDGISETSSPPAALQTDADTPTSAPARTIEPDTNSNRHDGRQAARSGGDERATVRASAQKPAADPSPAAAKAPLPAAREAAPEFPPLVQRRGPIQAQEISTAREPVRQGSDVFGFGAGIGALSGPSYDVAPFSVGRAPSPLSEPRADFEFIVRRRALERREVAEAPGEAVPKRSEADAAIATAAARRSIPAPGAASSSIVEVRWFSVAPHHLEAFRKDLAAEANIDSEKRPPADDQMSAERFPRDLLIKVVILPSER